GCAAATGGGFDRSEPEKIAADFFGCLLMRSTLSSDVGHVSRDTRMTMRRGEMRQELSRVLAIEETDEAHDAVVRSFWTRARAKTPATAPGGPPAGARVIDLLAWSGARALGPTPR